MAKLSTDELLDAFKEMTLLELSEFVKQFEETFDVTAAAPVAVAAAGGRCRSRRGRRGAVGVRRHPRGCRREEDRRHQGRPRDRLRPGPQGGQGSGRRRSQAAAGEGQQGRRRRRQGQARSRRRIGHRQVVLPRKKPPGHPGGFFVSRASRRWRQGHSVAAELVFRVKIFGRGHCGDVTERRQWSVS